MAKQMHDGGASIQVSQNAGDKNDILTYRHGRICRLPECRQLLNSYTPGPYCCCHQHKGAMIEMEKEEKRKRLLQKKSCARIKAESDAKRGDEQKRTWNKKPVKYFIPNQACGRCKKKFYRSKVAATYWTQEFCRACRPIVKAKEGIK